MPQENPSLSIFFPAYNEEANIRQSVEMAQRVAKSLTGRYEIIVVDDGSKDRTPQIADDLANADPNHVKVVHHHPNQGYGAAVWSGIKAATMDYIFFTDSDLQFDLSELGKLVKFVPKYRVVIGYRAKRRDPFMRIANAKAWNLLNRLLFGLKVKDIDCAFKLFDRHVFDGLEIESRGAMLSAEMLIRLQRQGITFKEVPVTHLPRTAGSPTGAKPAVILRAFREMVQVYRGDLGNVTYRQLVKFAIVGGTNTLLYWLIYYGLTRTTRYFAAHLLVANVTAFLLASVSSFILNHRWTFQRPGRANWREVANFYVVVMGGLIINTATLSLLLIPFHHHDLPAVFCATIASFIWNFTLSKLWVFKVESREAS